MNGFTYAVIITLIAGVGGTGLGGVIGALLNKKSDKSISLLLSFAGGVMLSVVCFDLIQTAITTGDSSKQSVLITILSVAIGAFVVFLLNHLIDVKVNKEVVKESDHPKTADGLDELIHSDHYATHKKRKDSKKDLFVAGVIMAIAIALHNFPEGMTIGAVYGSSDHDTLVNSGLFLGVIIGLHNIPEGMAIVVPLISGGSRKFRSILFTALSGLPTVIGAMIGYQMGSMGDLGVTISLGLAGGAMIYIVFGEILPQAFLLYKSKAPTFTIILGMLVGLAFIYLL